MFIVATANDISELPPEPIRKGCFDEVFFVDFPHAAAREQIATIHLRRRGHDPAAFDVAGIAQRAQGYSGAQIEQAIVAAAFEAKARDRAVDELIELVAGVDGILQAQAEADAGYFARAGGRTYTEAQIAQVEATLLAAYRWQYIVSGVLDERFQKALGAKITPAQFDRIGRALTPITASVAH